MKNLLQCAVFVTLESQLLDIANRIQSANVVHLMAPADVEGVLALSQLESALLDNSKNYLRRILPPRKHVSRDNKEIIPEVEGLVIHISPFQETQSATHIEENYIQLFPISVSLNFPNSSRTHNGAVDCTALCAALASILSPDGSRVRKQRPLTIAGSWLRSGADANYDPVLSILRDHLDNEGSIEIRPLPEVPSPEVSMIPGLSKMMLNRLQRSWPKMDIEQRSSAISELVLPSLRIEGISTMRLEELVWHRAMIPGNDVDIASQLHQAQSQWPQDETEAKVHASTILDGLITKGHF